MRSMVPSRSRCVGPTLVTTPTVGLRDLAEHADLTQVVHAHLEDGLLVGLVQLEHA